MRYPQNRHTPSSSTSQIFKWALICGVIIGGIYFIQSLSAPSNDSDASSGFLLSGSWKAVIIDADGKKRDAESGDVFSTEDSLLSVLSGMIWLEHDGLDIWLDKNASLNAKELSASGKNIELLQGRAWAESTKDTTVKLKHITSTLAAGSIALLEQQKIHSIVYALKGNISIETSNGKTYTLSSGKKMMVSQSDLANPWVDLDALTDTIDDSIKQTALFLARDGDTLLASTATDITTQSGTIVSNSGTESILNTTDGKFISLTSPLDGALISGNSINIEGKILSPSVSKIMVNDIEADKKWTENTWSIDNFSISKNTFDIVYKAYDNGGTLLQRGVITVYSSDKNTSTDKLVPTTFPTGDAYYKILSPSENPYKTTTKSITVSGSVPKDTVSFITVNWFRLKKFLPNSTSWYYYANTAYGTMQEGFNLYEIKFFDTNSKLLSTQLFTIIKEWNTTTLSWE